MAPGGANVGQGGEPLVQRGVESEPLLRLRITADR